MKKKIIFTVFLTLLFSTAGLAQSGIQKVDFKNFVYKPLCAGSDPLLITVNNGEFSEEEQQDGYVNRLYFNVFSVTYGDLTGDRQPEAIVLTVCNTGGTGNFSEGFIYTLKAGKPLLLARIEGGDRAHGGLRSAVVENGLLAVARNDAGENGGACCPEFAVTTRYKLLGDKLTASGASVRRELYPSEPLKFAKGASSGSVKLVIAPEDRKRFTLGARAGQIMSVSVDSPQVTTRLLEDALVTEGANGFTARLPKTGTYTVELSNYEETPVEVTLTVGIK